VTLAEKRTASEEGQLKIILFKNIISILDHSKTNAMVRFKMLIKEPPMTHQ